MPRRLHAGKVGVDLIIETDLAVLLERICYSGNQYGVVVVLRDVPFAREGEDHRGKTLEYFNHRSVPIKVISVSDSDPSRTLGPHPPSGPRASDYRCYPSTIALCHRHRRQTSPRSAMPATSASSSRYSMSRVVDFHPINAAWLIKLALRSAIIILKRNYSRLCAYSCPERASWMATWGLYPRLAMVCR